jgi:hypothetical protein
MQPIAIRFVRALPLVAGRFLLDQVESVGMITHAKAQLETLVLGAVGRDVCAAVKHRLKPNLVRSTFDTGRADATEAHSG